MIAGSLLCRPHHRRDDRCANSVTDRLPSRFDAGGAYFAPWRRRWSQNGWMSTGGRERMPVGRGWNRALRPTAVDVGAVSRSVLGVLAIAALGLVSGFPSAAGWASGPAAIAGAIAMQDSPAGRVQLVIMVSLELGAAVFLGSLTAFYGAL